MRPRLALVIAALCVTAAPALAQEPETEPGESAAIRTVVQGFKAALAAGDSTAALDYLHPDLVVYEGGQAETLAEYRAGHLAADMEFAAAVETEALTQGLVVRPGMALWASETETKGEFRGGAIESVGTETIVLLSTDAGWKILHIHWSSR